MPRKVFSISILLFTNIILLAHTVIPHHYHEETGLCFFLHCIDSKEAHKHENNDLDEHQHEGNPYANNCFIDDDYYAFSDNNKKITNTLTTLKCIFEKTISYIYLNNNIAVSIRQRPCLPLFYPEFVSRTIGLRAPPSDCC